MKFGDIFKQQQINVGEDNICVQTRVEVGRYNRNLTSSYSFKFLIGIRSKTIDCEKGRRLLEVSRRRKCELNGGDTGAGLPGSCEDPLRFVPMQSKGDQLASSFFSSHIQLPDSRYKMEKGRQEGRHLEERRVS